MVIGQQLVLNAARNLGKSAISYLGKETTYHALLESISRLSYLYQNELGNGVRMALLCRNCPAMLSIFFAITTCRGLVIPMTPAPPPDKMGQWLVPPQPPHLGVPSDLPRHAREILQAA